MHGLEGGEPGGSLGEERGGVRRKGEEDDGGGRGGGLEGGERRGEGCAKEGSRSLVLCGRTRVGSSDGL